MCNNENTSKKNRTNMFVWTLILVIMAAIAAGDVKQGPLLAQANESIESTPVDINEAQADVSAGGAIQSFKFNKEQPIRDALRVLAAKYQKNIVPSTKVEGILAFTTLTDVTFEEAMDAVLGANFKFEQTGNLIKVYTKEEYKKIKEDTDRMVYKAFTLYYVTAEEAKKLVSPLLSAAGKIQDSTKAEEGISTGKEGGTGQTGGNSMALHDAIVIYDYPENITKAEELLASIDVRPQQVLIEATILSATLTEDTQFGIDWNLLGGAALDGTAATKDYASPGGTTGIVDRGTEATTPIAQIGAGVVGTPMESTGFARIAQNGLRIGITSGNLAVFITALETVTDITILANPKILALNKQSGTVFIGKSIGYRDRTSIDSSGTATVGEVSFLDTGTKLSFRPYIGNDGYIRMEIYPQDSSGTLDAQGIPQKTTAELTTNIMVKDGQTIVIGGLFRDAITTSRSQIPLLGDLPLVGAAFRGTSDNNVRQEVIVILTPHIINEPQDTEPDARTADIARKRYGARMALQDISRAKLAEDHYTKAVSLHADGNNVDALCEINNALNLRPTYLEALRLKEKITNEISPDEAGRIERIMLGVVEQQDAPKWRRN